MSTIPFLKKNQEASISAPVESVQRKPDEGKEEDFDSLETAMQEFHQALNAKNYSGAAQIFRSCQELLDSEPHEEGEHI